MLVRTDDEVYRVDAVWLGPPRATFPWRARYVSYGLGLLVMILVMFVQRRIGIGLDFFSVAWALVITVADHPVPRQAHRLRAPARPGRSTLFRHEVTGPAGAHGAVAGAAAHVRIGARARPVAPSRRTARRSRRASQGAAGRRRRSA